MHRCLGSIVAIVCCSAALIACSAGSDNTSEVAGAAAALAGSAGDYESAGHGGSAQGGSTAAGGDAGKTTQGGSAPGGSAGQGSAGSSGFDWSKYSCEELQQQYATNLSTAKTCNAPGQGMCDSVAFAQLGCGCQTHFGTKSDRRLLDEIQRAWLSKQCTQPECKECLPLPTSGSCGFLEDAGFGYCS